MTLTAPTQDSVTWKEFEYKARSEEVYHNWLELLDNANAIRYGYAQYRQAPPGVPINVKAALARIKKVESGWAREQHYRDLSNRNAPAPKFTEMSISTQCRMHNQLVSIPEKDYSSNTANDN